MSLGDIAVVGEQNIFVEGVTDQILLANASSKLQATNRQHLDLERISIVPFSDEETLGHLLQTAARLGARSVVLVDSDKAGRTVLRKHAPTTQCREIGMYVDAPGRDCSVEDLIATDDYLAAVNDAYSGFEWFTPFEPEAVRHAIGQSSLGAYLENTFRARFQRSFSKTFVAVALVARAEPFQAGALDRFSLMITDLLIGLASAPEAAGR